MVHPEKQIWHCFGCGKGGDIFTFIQEIEGLDFPEALKLLADRAGVKIDTFRSEINKSERNRLLEINETAAYFFHRFLLEMSASKPAQDYLYVKRQLKLETVKSWQIGYIPEQWDLLTKYLLKKGFGIDDLVKSGLTIKRDNADAATGRGYYDRFRGRIMFPIWDVHGNVVGFTGRQLIENSEAGGKYVNTPQTSVYDKSRVIYGLNFAKTSIRSQDLTVLVEGQMDVIACHEAGMKNVVAASGTALTTEQVRLLKRYSANVAMAFDADSAGQEAARRGIGTAIEEGLNVKVIRLPEGAGKDADECLHKNPNVWFESVKRARDVMEWYLEKALQGAGVSTPHGKQKAADEILAEIARIPYSVERDEWLKKTGERLGIDLETLRQALHLRLTQKTTNTHTPASASAKPLAAPPKIPVGRQQMLAEAFWSLIIKFPELFLTLRPLLDQKYFIDTEFLSLYEEVNKQYNIKQSLDLDEIRLAVGAISGGENFLDVLLLRADKDFASLTETTAAAEALQLFNNLKQEWVKAQKEKLSLELKAAQTAGDRVREDQLLAEFMRLSRENF